MKSPLSSPVRVSPLRRGVTQGTEAHPRGLNLSREEDGSRSVEVEEVYRRHSDPVTVLPTVKNFLVDGPRR